MKHLLVAMIIVLLTCSVAGTQEPAPSLEIGPVLVHLGMTKAEVQSKASGLGILKPEDDFWMITTGGSKGEPYGTVRFAAGRVIYADRDWITSGSDAIEGILGATNSLTQEGISTCAISHDMVSVPGSPVERAVFACGTKRLLIAKGKVNGEDFEEIDESIGDSPK